MSSRFPPDEDAYFRWMREYCDKCQRYYNPKSPHVCFPDDISVEAERRRLKRWLGEDVETIE